jgi:hypothetical protein
MSKRVIERFFSFARRMFFEEISAKFRPGSAKKLMDALYIIFEKVAHKFDIMSTNYLKMYRELVEKEVKMADISSDDLVLVIGCGSLPATSVLIAMGTGAHVVYIDNDRRAVEEAYKFVKNLHLEDRIKVEHADGLFYPLNKFDVIFLLYGVKRQEGIFKSLAGNMKNNARIIFRTVIGIQDETMESSVDLSKWFLIKDKAKSETLRPAGSYLLFKKDPK